MTEKSREESELDKAYEIAYEIMEAEAWLEELRTLPSDLPSDPPAEWNEDATQER